MLAVFPASERFHSQKFRSIIGSKRLRFATEEEVLELSGCLSGAVPPFGSLFSTPLKTYVDKKLSEVNEINFNGGLRTASI